MELDMEQVKEMIMFCKTSGVTHFVWGELEFQVIPDQPPVNEVPQAQYEMEQTELQKFLRGDI